MLIAIAFLIWIGCFWSFLSGHVPLTSDAISYYDHTRFFLENLAHGVFPLWDPHWSGGVPNDFFLRRIGPYNPFLLIPVLLSKLGVGFFYAYMAFQVSYFFCGMLGFYALARRLLQDTNAAFLAFLVLLFSVQGTRMFDSYMLLVTVPTIWFFYFLTAFFQRPSRAVAAGLTLCVMVLLTTYIPFYFFLIVAFFLLVYVLICWRDLPTRVGQARDFVRSNPVFTLFCLGAVVAAAMPAVMFFHEAGKGGVAIPGRNAAVDAKNALVAESQLSSPWSIMEEFFFSSYFTDLSRMAFAIVYVPLFAMIVLTAGIFIKVSRLFLVLLLWGVVLVLFSMPIGVPLYGFLYHHLGFIRYFRNLHFLLWFALLPMFALFTGEVWRAFHAGCNGKKRRIAISFVVLAHLLALSLLRRQPDVINGTWLALGAGAVCWVVFLLFRERHYFWIPGLLLVAVVIQPIEVFHHLADNYRKCPHEYFYDHINGRFSHTTEIHGEGRISAPEGAPYPPEGQKPGTLYYSTDVYRDLRSHLSAVSLEQYERYKFRLYDQEMPPTGFAGAFAGTPVREDSTRFRVTDFNANGLVIHADLDHRQFVVYSDAYYPGWRLTVNGHPVPVVRANHAFKGFWLPAGKSVAVLRYGTWWSYLWNSALMLLFCSMAFYTVLSCRRKQHA